MKNSLMNLYDKILLKKRLIIETFFGKLKQECNLEYSRHRSQRNFFVNILSALAAYQLSTRKPKIKL